MIGQDFVIPIEGGAATTHLFNRANNSSLEPRVIRWAQKLVIASSGQGLLKKLQISGTNLVLGDGFPLEGLVPNAQTEAHNAINCAVGPTSPFELEATTTASATLAGYVGTDVPDPALLPEISAVLDDGLVYGTTNFAWGLGEKEQANANTAETVSFSARIPRAMTLERMVVCLYRTSGTVARGNFKLSKFQIAGSDMLSTSGKPDMMLFSPQNTDTMGLSINRTIGPNDLVEIVVDVAALGSGIKGTVQIGFFTS